MHATLQTQCQMERENLHIDRGLRGLYAPGMVSPTVVAGLARATRLLAAGDRRRLTVATVETLQPNPSPSGGAMDFLLHALPLLHSVAAVALFCWAVAP
jgi:hypothetical protein